MIKKKYHPTKHDFKTGFFYKLSLYFGIFLLIISAILLLFSIFLTEDSSGFLKDIYILSHGTAVESIAALSIIFIAIGLIIYFLHCQFIKLDEIAKDIEKSDGKEKK